MEQFEAVPKKRGSSMGIIIPHEVVERKNIQVDKKVNVLIISDWHRETASVMHSRSRTA